MCISHMLRTTHPIYSRLKSPDPRCLAEAEGLLPNNGRGCGLFAKMRWRSVTLRYAEPRPTVKENNQFWRKIALYITDVIVNEWLLIHNFQNYQNRIKFKSVALSSIKVNGFPLIFSPKYSAFALTQRGVQLEKLLNNNSILRGGITTYRASQERCCGWASSGEEWRDAIGVRRPRWGTDCGGASRTELLGGVAGELDRLTAISLF